VAKVIEKLVLCKQRSHKFHIERFNLKKLHKVDGQGQYGVEASKSFAALEDLDTEVDIKSVKLLHKDYYIKIRLL
jgi:hypothetical protein